MAFDLTKAIQGSLNMGSQGAYIGNQLRSRYGSKKSIGIGAAAGSAAGFFLGGLSGGPDPNLAANQYDGVYDAIRADTMRRARQSGKAMQQNIRQSLSSRGINTSLAAAGIESANQGRLLARAEESLLPVYTQMKTAGAQDRIHAKRIAEHERRQGYMDTLLALGVTGINMSKELAAEHEADKFKKEQEMKEQEAKTLPSAFETWDAGTQKAFLQGKGIFVPDNWDSMTPQARQAYIQASGFKAFGPSAPTQQTSSPPSTQQQNPATYASDLPGVPPGQVQKPQNPPMYASDLPGVPPQVQASPQGRQSITPPQGYMSIGTSPPDPLPAPVPLSPEQRAGMPPEYTTGTPPPQRYTSDPLPAPVPLSPEQRAGMPPDYPPPPSITPPQGSDPLPAPVPLSPEQRAGMPPGYPPSPQRPDPLPSPVPLSPEQRAGMPPDAPNNQGVPMKSTANTPKNVDPEDPMAQYRSPDPNVDTDGPAPYAPGQNEKWENEKEAHKRHMERNVGGTMYFRWKEANDMGLGMMTTRQDFVNGIVYIGGISQDDVKKLKKSMDSGGSVPSIFHNFNNNDGTQPRIIFVDPVTDKYYSAAAYLGDKHTKRIADARAWWTSGKGLFTHSTGDSVVNQWKGDSGQQTTVSPQAQASPQGRQSMTPPQGYMSVGASPPPTPQAQVPQQVPQAGNEQSYMQSYMRRRLQSMTARGEGGFTATPIEDPSTGWNIGIGRSLTKNGMHLTQEIIPFMRNSGMSNIEIQEKLRSVGITDIHKIQGKIQLTPDQFNVLFPKGITPEQSDVLFNNDYTMFQNSLRRSLGGNVYDNLDPARKMALLDMIYTLGEGSFKGFNKMIDAIRNKDWDRAAAEMKNAEWYTGKNQPGPRRVDPLAEMMRTGRMPGDISQNMKNTSTTIDNRNSLEDSIKTIPLHRPNGRTPEDSISTLPLHRQDGRTPEQYMRKLSIPESMKTPVYEDAFTVITRRTEVF